MRLGQELHLFERFVVELERQIKRLGNGLVGDVIVAGQVRTGNDAVVNVLDLRRPNASTILMLESIIQWLATVGKLAS